MCYILFTRRSQKWFEVTVQSFSAKKMQKVMEGIEGFLLDKMI